MRRPLPVAAVLFATACAAVAQPTPTVVPIAGGQSGIGFDDLRYSAALKRVIVPAALTVLFGRPTWSYPDWTR